MQHVLLLDIRVYPLGRITASGPFFWDEMGCFALWFPLSRAHSYPADLPLLWSPHELEIEQRTGIKRRYRQDAHHGCRSVTAGPDAARARAAAAISGSEDGGRS